MAQVSSLYAIVGSTGTGKTELSLNLAERIASGDERHPPVPAEVVNADAMQLYRDMDIGTAKLPERDRRGIPHHMFDVLDVTEESAVAEYQRQSRAVIEQILRKPAAAILVGGSGLYVSSVLFDFEFPKTDPAIRSQLEREADERGIQSLLERLRQLDPDAAASVDVQNPRRVIRALEIVEITGRPTKIGLPEKPKAWRDVSVVGLFEPRDVLVARLDERVEQMWRDGLLDEVRRLRHQGLERGVTARRAIGYAQALAQLEGELSEREAIEQAQALTRRYARRQMSWFKRYPGVRWYRADDPRLVDRLLDASDPGDPIKP